jgi:protein-disulfide isomerase
MSRIVVAALSVALACGASAVAQTAVGGTVSNFKDTSMLKPPAGDKIALIEWEDLECPACAHAFPFVHEAINHYKIPYVRYDFLIPGHIWSRTAAIYARWMQDTISPEFGEDYRRQVFANQFRIASEDDLKQFTQQYLTSHGKQMPFVVDPKQQYINEIEADVALANRLGLNETPTLIVVTRHGWIQVKSTDDLYKAIDEAEAAVAHEGTAAPVHHTVAKKK